MVVRELYRTGQKYECSEESATLIGPGMQGKKDLKDLKKTA